MCISFFHAKVIKPFITTKSKTKIFIDKQKRATTIVALIKNCALLITHHEL